MGEQEQLREESQRLEFGAEPRDLEQYSTWRETTDLCILDILDFYATYLVGQTNGFSEALSLASVFAAFEIDEVPQETRRQATRFCLILHTELTGIMRAREKSASLNKKLPR